MASRLEKINKNYKTRIIVSDTVYEQIKDTYILRMIDCVIVKGRTQSSCIYELLGDAVQKPEFDFIAYNSSFEKGFLSYKQQHWDDAIACFRTCLEIYPIDNIAPIFIARCVHFKSTPPPADWDGTWKH
jgi:adenylate cyclase